MSSKEEQKAAKLRAKAAAAEIQLQQFMRKAEKDLNEERERSARKRSGLPPSHADAEEEIAEEERKRKKNRTVFGKLRSVFKKKSRSRSRSPPPGYAPPAYSRDATIGGTRRRRVNKKKTRKIMKRKTRR